MSQNEYSIENAAGGDYREFALTRLGGMSAEAIAHASQIGYMGPRFGGPAGEIVRAQWDSEDE